jgi:hypothetical protein
LKEIAVSFNIGGKECKIGGIAKGSGMIHPNMATMLVFITTDCAISPQMLQKALSSDIKNTFNMVSVDGDTSTNDMVTVLANGMAGNDEIVSDGEDLDIGNLYYFLHTLVLAINEVEEYDYCWVYFEHDYTAPVYFEEKYYLNGDSHDKDSWEKTMTNDQKNDGGYYYLCQKVGNAVSPLLKPVAKSSLQTFFMDGTFLIPWTLTNSSASCNLYATVQFQAIQTFIPIVYNPNETNASSKEYHQDSKYHGTISKAENNRFPEDSVRYDTYSAQAVWNSCEFDSITADWVTSGEYKVQSSLPKTE